MFSHFGPMEIGIIFLIILIIFGVGKLPQVGGAIGKGIHEFRKATRGESSDEKNEDSKSKVASDSKTSNT